MIWTCVHCLPRSQVQTANLLNACGNHVETMWKQCGNYVEIMWKLCGNYVETMWKPLRNHVETNIWMNMRENLNQFRPIASWPHILSLSGGQLFINTDISTILLHQLLLGTFFMFRYFRARHVHVRIFCCDLRALDVLTHSDSPERYIHNSSRHIIVSVDLLASTPPL